MEFVLTCCLFRSLCIIHFGSIHQCLRSLTAIVHTDVFESGEKKCIVEENFDPFTAKRFSNRGFVNIVINIKLYLLFIIYSIMFSVCNPLKDETSTSCARVYRFSAASSSSLRFRESLTRTRVGGFLIPVAQTNLFRPASIRTSWVFMAFWANLRISLTARGARRLN